MTIKIAPFDASEYLDSEEMIAEYLSAALEEDDPNIFLTTLANVAKAQGMAKMAKDAGLGRESLPGSPDKPPPWPTRLSETLCAAWLFYE